MITLELTIVDVYTLNGGVPIGAPNRVLTWVRMPWSFFSNGELTPAAREHFCAYYYGPEWMIGDESGGRYRVDSIAARPLSDAELVGFDKRLAVFAEDGTVAPRR